jgi:hypothetical protein
MRNRAGILGGLAVILFIVLALLAHKPIGPPKARAQRITGVNTVRSVSLTLTNTNALSGTQRGLGK